jgi:hypothetical protein
MIPGLSGAKKKELWKWSELMWIKEQNKAKRLWNSHWHVELTQQGRPDF